MENLGHAYCCVGIKTGCFEIGITSPVHMQLTKWTSRLYKPASWQPLVYPGAMDYITPHTLANMTRKVGHGSISCTLTVYTASDQIFICSYFPPSDFAWQHFKTLKNNFTNYIIIYAISISLVQSTHWKLKTKSQTGHRFISLYPLLLSPATKAHCGWKEWYTRTHTHTHTLSANNANMHIHIHTKNMLTYEKGQTVITLTLYSDGYKQ